jgi:Mg2+ and Co2+ transporter CorA
MQGGRYNTPMISKYVYKGVVWVDSESPTQPEIDHINEELAIPENLTKNILSESRDLPLSTYDSHLKFTLDFPILKENHAEYSHHYITFIIGPKSIITIHKNQCDILASFSKKLEVSLDSESTENTNDSVSIFTAILKKLAESQKNQNTAIENTINRLESMAFKHTKNEFNKSHKINNTLNSILLATKNSIDTLPEIKNNIHSISPTKTEGAINKALLEYKKIKNSLEKNQSALGFIQDKINHYRYTSMQRSIRTISLFTILSVSFLIIMQILNIKF